MVCSSEVRIACPSISFLFAHLGGSLGVFPNAALTELCPFLRQSIDWFEGLIREQGIMCEVRSNELDTELSSGAEPAKGDTAVSTP